MSELPPSDPVSDHDVARARAQAATTGASDLGLLAPTPLAMGFAASSLIAGVAPASAAAAAVSAPSDASDNGGTSHVAAATHQDAATVPASMVQTAAATAAIPVATLHTPLAVEPASMAVRPAPVDLTQSLPGGAPPVADAASAQVETAAGAAPVGNEEAIAAVRAHADALTGALQALVERIGGNDPVAAQGTGEADAVFASVGESVAAITASLDARLAETGAVVSNIGDTLDTALGHVDAVAVDAADTLGTVLSATNAITDTLTDQAALIGADVVAHGLDTAAAVTNGASTVVADVAQQAGSRVGQSVEAATETVSDVASAATDALFADLGGADPQAGLATLTGMLDQANGFAIVDTALPEAAAPVFESVGALAADLMEAPDAIADVTDMLPLGDTPMAGLGALGDTKLGLGGLFDHGDAHG